MDATHMRLGVLIGAIMLVGWVAGCGSSAKLMSGLSIEELKPVPGILPSARLIRGTISSFSGDRVEVETGERAPRYLSLEAGGDEARGLQPGGPWRSWSTIATRLSPISDLPISRPRKSSAARWGDRSTLRRNE